MTISAPEAEKTPGKRQRARNVRKRRTSEILDAAELEFARTGFDGTSVLAIAERAGLQKRQILYFYRNKENLYRTVIDRIFTEWRSRDLESWEGEPKQIIFDYIDHMFEHAEEKPHRNKLVINEMIRGGQAGIAVMEQSNSRPVMANTIARLRRWMDRGLMRRTDPLHFVFMLWGLQHFYVVFEPEVAFFLGKSKMDRDDWSMIREQVKANAIAYF